MAKNTAIAATLMALVTIANAQVHRCIDANGKATYSDTACPTTTERTDQVLGRSATARRDEPEDAGYVRNMESINRSRATLQDSVDLVTRQSQAPAGGGAAIMEAQPNQQVRSILPGTKKGAERSDDCETTSTRKGCIGGSRNANSNWSPNRGYYGGGGQADQRYELDQERARQATAARAAQPPVRMTNCNSSGCWDSHGNRYNRAGDGSRLIGVDGRTCRDDGVRVICN